MLCFGVVLVCAVCAAQDLNPTVQPNLVLWLTADAGVEVTAATATVLRWKDQSGGRYEFVPLAAAQHRQASARFFAAVSKQRQQLRPMNARGDAGMGPPVDAAEAFAARQVGRAVRFPAPLVANNVQLRDGLTAFFVVKPAWLEDGDQAVGQRFFGHYPYGQFRFHDRHLAFKTDGGDYVHSADDIADDEWIIAAYRFDGDVSIALSGLPFERIGSPRRGDHHTPAFSTSGYVTLGGCPPYNSFIGEIAEVMVFGVPITDADARHVAEILAARHDVVLREGGMPALVAFNGGANVQPLPARHSPGEDARAKKTSTIPALPALLDPLEPSRPHERAVDRLAVYKRIKESRAATRTAQAGMPNAEASEELLEQIREAQARLSELQNQAGGSAPAPASAAVSKWTPPGDAPLAQVQKWKAAVTESETSIKTFPRGGKELRAFVHDQVTALRLLRHNTFCALLRDAPS